MSNPFDSPGDDFNSNFSKMGENAELLKNNYEALLVMTTKINTKEDSTKFRQTLKTKVQFNFGLIKETQEIIKKLEKLAKGQGREQIKLVEKCKEDFEKFIQSFHQRNNIISQKLETPVGSYSSKESDMHYSNTKNPFDDDDASETLLKQQQQFARFEIDNQDDLINERDREIKVITSQMRDVNDIFKSLAQLVEEQSEMVDHIQVNISNANSNVAIAVSEIGQAEKIQEGSNNKLCILLIVIVIILVVVVGGLTTYFMVKKS